MRKTNLLVVLLFISAALIYGQNFDGFGELPRLNQTVNPTLQKGMDKANDAQDKAGGLVPMRFFNALDRKPIPGASVEIPNVGTFTTSSEGKIAFPKKPDGNYTLIFTKEGFITTPIDFRILLGAVDINWYNISPGFSSKDYRIVLEWAEKPADLDIHFEKTGGSGQYHIAYHAMKSAEDGNTVLDRDDTSGYGPETVTVGKVDIKGSYICWVHDYTNRNNGASTQMAKEGAVVRVYSQNRLMHTFRIPANGVGARWNVFKIEKGSVTPVNTVTAK